MTSKLYMKKVAPVSDKKRKSFRRKSELGVNLQSVFLEVVAKSGKKGIDRDELFARLKKDPRCKKSVKEKTHLNAVYTFLMNDRLITKEKRRNAAYFVTNEGAKQVKKNQASEAYKAWKKQRKSVAA